MEVVNDWSHPRLFFQDEPLDQLIDDTARKHDDGNSINGMHYLQVEIGWPVRVFFPEKVHEQI